MCDAVGFGKEAVDLQEAADALDESHFGEREFLEEAQLEPFGDVEVLNDFVEASQDVKGIITLVPKILRTLRCLSRSRDSSYLIEVSSAGLDDDILDDFGLGLVADLEDVFVCDLAAAGHRGLQVVQGASHIAVTEVHEGLESLLVELDVFGLDDLDKSFHDLLVRKPGKAHDGTAGLDGLDDLGGVVAGEG